MARTFREQLGDNWATWMVLLVIGLLPLATGWITKMTEMHVFIGLIVSLLVMGAIGVIITLKKEKKSKASIDVSGLLFEGDIVQGLDTPEVYYIHNRMRHWLASPEIASYVNPNYSALKFSLPATLLSRIPLGPRIATLADAVKYLELAQ